MASSLPDFPKFDVNAEPSSLGVEWINWLDRFENLLIALAVEDDARKKALMLYYGGKELHDVYKTLAAATDDYEATKDKLTAKFQPSKNVTFEVYNFRSLKQLEGESIDKYVTRLKESSSRCGFADVDLEIKHQIVFSCRSNRLRRKALEEDSDLAALVKYARSLEITKAQAQAIEEGNKIDVNKIGKPGKYSKRFYDTEKTKNEVHAKKEIKSCFNCGGDYPHLKGRSSCPAFGKSCSKCQLPNHFARVCRKKVNNLQTNPTETDSGDTSESSDNEYSYTVPFVQKSNINNVTANIKIKLENKKIRFQIDSGASVNIINESVYNSLQTAPKLKKSKVKLYPYASKRPLPVIGHFTGDIETKKKIGSGVFYVVKGTDTECLLGLETALELGVIQICNAITKNGDENGKVLNVLEKIKKGLPVGIQKILDKHTSRFIGVGKLSNEKAHLTINHNVRPVAIKHRRIPFHMRDKVSEELNRLRENGIIEKVKEPTGWVSPVVLVNKFDGRIRLCVDMREPNKAIERIRHVIPTIDDLKQKINGATVFSRLDLKNAYHQLELSEDSRNITTFSTHEGLDRFCRLNDGTSSAAEIFHNKLEEKLDGRGNLNIYDDILIFGVGDADHEDALDRTLETLKKWGLTVNLDKSEFYKSSIKFFGLIFSKEGVSPDPEKVEALQRAEPPTSKAELRSFLGMLNFSSEFIEKFSDQTAILRKLTREKVRWTWTNAHQKSFEKLKHALCEKTMLSYFNPAWETELICDGSPFGVSGILTQIDPSDNQRRVIAYASRSLTDAESRYGQIEREALAIHFACLRFQIYLLGKHFSVITDHNPLVHMFNNPRTQMPYRVERIRMKLQGFNFTVHYTPGKENISDFISRKPIKMKNDDRRAAKELEKHVHFIINEGLPNAVSLDDIKEAAKNDKTSKMLKKAVQKGYIDKKSEIILHDYKKNIRFVMVGSRRCNNERH